MVLYNDDFTPMGFVVGVLEIVFSKSPAESNALMLRIHRSGSGIAGVYPLEIAETITVMHHGRVVAEGDRASIVRDPRVREVYFAG